MTSTRCGCLTLMSGQRNASLCLLQLDCLDTTTVVQGGRCASIPRCCLCAAPLSWGLNQRVTHRRPHSDILLAQAALDAEAAMEAEPAADADADDVANNQADREAEASILFAHGMPCARRRRAQGAVCCRVCLPTSTALLL